MKVSFDFDSTLSISFVEEYAKKLVEEGHIVWIVTSRKGFGKEPTPQWNDDLFATAERIGIPREQIFFTCLADKFEFLKDKGFLWHLDDDIIELSFIRTYTDVFPVWRASGNDWFNQCKDLIRILENKRQE